MTYSVRISAILFLSFISTATVQGQHSIYSDVKAHGPGDVLTVILTENINGSSSSDARVQSNTNGSATSSVSGSMIPLDAVFGANAQVDYESDERALSNQRQLLSGTLSVRITEVDENGNYLINGSRSTEISGDIYSMQLSGYVRREDISNSNEVFSYRIANADIIYQNKGGFGSMNRKKGFERKLLWGVIGIVTGVSAIMAAK